MSETKQRIQVLQQIKKELQDNTAYANYLNKALENNETLTASPKAVKKELDKYLSQQI